MGNPSDKPRRRWFQFSLRALLILVLAIALPCGWIGWELEKTRREQEIVDELSAIMPDGFYYKVGGVYSYESKLPAWLVRRFRRVAGIRSRWNDCEFIDDDLMQLGRLTKLEWLFLDGSDVTDDGLPHLNRLVYLEMLSLSDTQVTNAGLVQLKTLPRLRCLFLEGTSVTDGGLAHLAQLTSIELLSLRGTRVTAEGVEKLQRAVPNCEIQYGPRFHPLAAPVTPVIVRRPVLRTQGSFSAFRSFGISDLRWSGLSIPQNDEPALRVLRNEFEERSA